MCKISIIFSKLASFRFKQGISIVTKQFFRANFWALCLLFSGLTGLMGSYQLLALTGDGGSDSESDIEMFDLLRAPSGRPGSSRAASAKAAVDGLATSLSRMSVSLHDRTLFPDDGIAHEFSGATAGLPVISGASDDVLGYEADDDSGSDSEDKTRFASLASVAVSLDAERDRKAKRNRSNSEASVGYVADIDSDMIGIGARVSAKKARLVVGSSRTTDDLGRKFGGASKTTEPVKTIARFTDVSMRDKSTSGAAGASAGGTVSDRIIVRRRKPVVIIVSEPVPTVPIASRARAMSL